MTVQRAYVHGLSLQRRAPRHPLRVLDPSVLFVVWLLRLPVVCGPDP